MPNDVGNKAGRKALSEQAGVSEAMILDFVHPANMTRMPSVSGRIAKQSWPMGYTKLERLRSADPERLFDQTTNCYTAHGKGKPSEATVRTSSGMIEVARRLSAAVEK
jgi:hypothetical protein